MAAAESESNMTSQEKMTHVVYLQKALGLRGAENEYSDLGNDRKSLVGALKCDVCLQNP